MAHKDKQKSKAFIPKSIYVHFLNNGLVALKERRITSFRLLLFATYILQLRFVGILLNQSAFDQVIR